MPGGEGIGIPWCLHRWGADAPGGGGALGVQLPALAL